MLFQNEQMLHDVMKERGWFIMDRKLATEGEYEGKRWKRATSLCRVRFEWDPDKQTCLGAYLRIYYIDGHLSRVLIPFEHYRRIRAYVESIWQKEGIMRINAESKERDLRGSYSISMRGIDHIEWWYWYGPKEHFGKVESFPDFMNSGAMVDFNTAIDVAYDNLWTDFSINL